MYEALADFVMVLHAAIIVGIVVGLVLSIISKRLRPIETGILLTIVSFWLLTGGCPLTNVEYYLRLHTAHPVPLLQVGFIPYYSLHWFGFTVADNLIKVLVYICIFVLCVTLVKCAPRGKKK